MVDMVHQLQDRICEAVEAVDGITYRAVSYTHLTLPTMS